MRIDDYQKWLDSMFVDETPAPSASSADETPEAPNDIVEEAAPQQAAPMPTASYTSQAASLPQSHARNAPPRPVSGEDEDEVPQIQDYLPFRRGRQSAELEVATESPILVAHSEPVQTTITVEIEDEPEVAEEEPVTEEVAQEIAPVEVVKEPAEEVTVAAQEAAAPVAEAVPERTPAKRMVSPARSRQVTSTRRLEAGEAMKPDELWSLVPRHLKTLFAMQSDEVAQNSYKREFKESRVDLISRLLDPTLSLEETARLLNVCPTTVRRYTNRGMLTHHRTQGDQRRFRLSDVLTFLDAGNPRPE